MGNVGGEDEDLYATLKGLQRNSEFLDIQEEYIKDEMKNLKRELIRAKEVSILLILAYFFFSSPLILLYNFRSPYTN